MSLSPASKLARRKRLLGRQRGKQLSNWRPYHGLVLPQGQVFKNRNSPPDRTEFRITYKGHARECFVTHEYERRALLEGQLIDHLIGRVAAALIRRVDGG